MQLIVDIENQPLADKIVKLLEIFKNDGVKVKAIDNGLDSKEELPEFDVDYENSIQYKLDRAEFEEMKESQ